MIPISYAKQTRCSKRPGQYCRLHNPQPTSETTVEWQGTSYSMFSHMLRPASGEQLVAEVERKQKVAAANPTDEEAKEIYLRAEQSYRSTLQGLNALSEEVDKAYGNLKQSTSSSNISLLQVQRYAEPGGKYPEITSAYNQYVDTVAAYQQAKKGREESLKSYYKELVAETATTLTRPDEFNNPEVARLITVGGIIHSEGNALTPSSLGFESEQAMFAEVYWEAGEPKMKAVDAEYIKVATGEEHSNWVETLSKVRLVRAYAPLLQEEKEGLKKLVYAIEEESYGKQPKAFSDPLLSAIR